MNGETEAFWEAALLASSFYHNHLLTTTQTTRYQTGSFGFLWICLNGVGRRRFATPLVAVCITQRTLHNLTSRVCRPRRDGSSAKLPYANQHITRCIICQTMKSIMTQDVFTQFTDCAAEQMKRELDELR